MSAATFAAPPSALAPANIPPPAAAEFSPTDYAMMRRALHLAGQAAAAGEAPVGAVVHTAAGDIVGEGRNEPIGGCDPTAHAEVVALRRAAAAAGNYRLPGLHIAVTLEPCAMCVGAIFHARLAGVVFAAADPKTGACGGAVDLPAVGKLNHQTIVRGGLLAEESAALLAGFFAARR